MNAINQHAEELRKARLSEISSAIDMSHNELVMDVYNNPKGKMPESLFVNYFLPKFIGEIPIEPNDQVFVQWIAIAGSPFSPVGIIDNTGQLLYVVPPIFDSTALNPTVGDFTMGEIFENYTLHAQQSPVRGLQFLGDQLNKRIHEAINNNTPLGMEWKNILSKYGKLPSTPDASVNVSEMDDDLIYD